MGVCLCLRPNGKFSIVSAPNRAEAVEFLNG